ncbi:DUF4097 and DUF4098 domain-containing protein YvlB [Oikeobacillus pervagus]|uniref:DUF4097 and DUF4098 domain-containing protein YvlB n=1 Tax=Oikeobacillus pervagus TaxID=1325931 RepID=A0AAJ1T0N7_9BACI|nr:DUF4097 family beta strand repeat-containing protein [Oikeobacillus pervagus]MDQ0216398.1 DUF4097 and DUF4098 domain-containing protein YvlB [Oikeobacillus pervagus]
MNSTRKKFTLIASGMIVIGILLTAIGFFAGAKLSIVNTEDGFQALGNHDRKAEEFSLTEFANIEGDLQDTDIEIIPSNEYKLKIERLAGTKVTHKITNDTLVLKESDHEPLWQIDLNFGTLTKKVVKIYVPKEVTFGNISLKNRFGDVRLDGMKVERLTIHSSEGDLTLNDIQSNQLTIENKFGDMNANNVITEDLNVEMHDGDAKFDSVRANSTVFQNEFGDLNFLNFTSEALTIQSKDGDIEIQGMLLGNSVIHSNFGDTKLQLLNKESNLSYNIHNDFGDITVNNNRFEKNASHTTNSQHKLDITSTDGDVHVTF